MKNNEMTQDELKALNDLVGATNAAIRLPVVNQIKCFGETSGEDANGDVTKIEPHFVLADMVNAKKDVKPTQTDIAPDFNAVILFVRRRLVERDTDGNTVLSTSEHSMPTDVVTLYKADKTKEVGVAKELREKYGLKTLKTIQYLYILRNGIVEKMVVKGMALGKNEANGRPSLYDYIASFKGNGDYIFANNTKFGVVKEQVEIGGKKKSFYVLSMSRGGAVDPKDMVEVAKQIRSLKELFTRYDEQNAKGVATHAADENIINEEDTIKYEAIPQETDNVDLSTIPF